MASYEATHKALGVQEIVDMIAKHVCALPRELDSVGRPIVINRDDAITAKARLKQLRLVNARFCKAATGPLFEQISLAFGLFGANMPHNTHNDFATAQFKIRNKDLASAIRILSLGPGLHWPAAGRLVHRYAWASPEESRPDDREMSIAGRAWLGHILSTCKSIRHVELGCRPEVARDALQLIGHEKSPLKELSLYRDDEASVKDWLDAIADDNTLGVFKALERVNTLRIGFALWLNPPRSPMVSSETLRKLFQMFPMLRHLALGRVRHPGFTLPLSKLSKITTLELDSIYLSEVLLKGAISSSTSLESLILHNIRLTSGYYAPIIDMIAERLPQLQSIRLEVLQYPKVTPQAAFKPDSDNMLALAAENQDPENNDDQFGPLRTLHQGDRTAFDALLNAYDQAKRARGHMPLLAWDKGIESEDVEKVRCAGIALIGTGRCKATRLLKEQERAGCEIWLCNQHHPRQRKKFNRWPWGRAATS